MKLYRIILWLVMCVLAPAWAHAQSDLYVPRSLLEVNTELRLLSFGTNHQRALQAFEFTVNFGLDWQKWRYVSIHGLFQMGFISAVDDKFANITYNHRFEQQVLPEFGLMAMLDVHPQNRIVAFLAAVRSGIVIAPRRTGIMSCDVGLGLMARPFYWNRQKILQSVGFGTMLWFAVYDEYFKVFSLDQDLLNPAISFSLEF